MQWQVGISRFDSDDDRSSSDSDFLGLQLVPRANLVDPAHVSNMMQWQVGISHFDSDSPKKKRKKADGKERSANKKRSSNKRASVEDQNTSKRNPQTDDGIGSRVKRLPCKDDDESFQIGNTLYSKAGLAQI